MMESMERWKGAWSWPDLWWKAGCGCMGYGGVLLYQCGKTERPFRVEPSEVIDLDECMLSGWSIKPLDLKEKQALIEKIEREFELGRKAREILAILREIGKLTDKK